MHTLGISYGTFGGGTGPIHFRGPLCTGMEYRLSDCQYDNNTEEEQHYNDWGVYCYIGLCTMLFIVILWPVGKGNETVSISVFLIHV